MRRAGLSASAELLVIRAT